ncbi:H-2 class I histocompatibility antigen, D-P alpha chain-like [Notothenia coriiceps]|uniref:H-2 class I histocompatibility antigen, D-P alpha chain-like n=1 Tax=Notothenia coriiceps TaxID=8208 RepID=A0A6I9P463_9TELE|nr:PREDICTED: H-2 class I histocompatibility antigen, D-P alpha chain-like [Notothenia coriiceps]
MLWFLFPAPPKVYVFSRKATSEKNIILSCMATGFYPKDILLQIKRNGRILTKEDGVCTTNTRPNGDETYQRTDGVEILRTDLSTYTCEVKHVASGMHVEQQWDHTLPSDPGSIIVVVVVVLGVVLLLVALAVLLILYKKGMLGVGTSGKKSKGGSSNSDSSDQALQAVTTKGGNDIEASETLMKASDDSIDSAGTKDSGVPGGTPSPQSSPASSIQGGK